MLVHIRSMFLRAFKGRHHTRVVGRGHVGDGRLLSTTIEYLVLLCSLMGPLHHIVDDVVVGVEVALLHKHAV